MRKKWISLARARAQQCHERVMSAWHCTVWQSRFRYRSWLIDWLANYISPDHQLFAHFKNIFSRFEALNRIVWSNTREFFCEWWEKFGERTVWRESFTASRQRTGLRVENSRNHREIKITLVTIISIIDPVSLAKIFRYSDKSGLDITTAWQEFESVRCLHQKVPGPSRRGFFLPTSSSNVFLVQISWPHNQFFILVPRVASRCRGAFWTFCRRTSVITHQSPLVTTLITISFSFDPIFLIFLKSRICVQTPFGCALVATVIQGSNSFISTQDTVTRGAYRCRVHPVKNKLRR